MRVSSNGNKVSFNNIAGTGIGLDVLGNNNTFKSGTIGPNAGGVHIGPGKTGNSLSGATIQDNSLYGVWIEGSSNTLQSTKLYRNAVANILVSGASNKILGNGVESATGDGIYVTGGSNLIQDNKVSKNTGDGIEIFAGANNTLKSDASNNSRRERRSRVQAQRRRPQRRQQQGRWHGHPVRGQVPDVLQHARAAGCVRMTDAFSEVQIPIDTFAEGVPE